MTQQVRLRLVAIVAAVLTAFSMGAVTASAAPSFNAWPVVKYGAKNSQVTTIQYLLKAHGVSVDVDGSYGPETRTGVTTFQGKKGLAKDGVTGQNTWKALTSYTVRYGSEGNTVRALQTQLRRNGYSVDVDGKFGPATQSAVRSFQSAKGLSVDGVVGPNTWRGLIAGVSGGGGGGNQAVAQEILNNSRISMPYWCGPQYASARQNIADTAAGRTPYTGGGHPGKKAVPIDGQVLRFARDLGRNNSFQITTILGCAHSAGSLHYVGKAIDIDYFNGQKLNTTSAGRAAAAQVRQACRDAGARKTLGPGDAGHSTHVHCNW